MLQFISIYLLSAMNPPVGVINRFRNYLLSSSDKIPLEPKTNIGYLGRTFVILGKKEVLVSDVYTQFPKL